MLVSTILCVLIIAFAIGSAVFIAGVVVPWACENDGKPLFQKKRKRMDSK